MEDQSGRISVVNISKSFDLRYQRGDSSLKGSFVSAGRDAWNCLRRVFDPTFETNPNYMAASSARVMRGRPSIDVLRSLSLNVKEGETVALIGRNGSGKSTLLKILAGIYRVDGGSVSVLGRVSPLIELGAGFHPEFSGRDNILLNGQILGLSKNQLLDRIEEIIDFSDLKDFIDYPVRTYSSGMYMRLAFSVAVNVDPDILLIDEILAVGDARFQAKCHEKLDEFKKRRKTIILVTHSLGIVESWATRAVYLREGCVAFDGNPSTAVAQYLQDAGQGVIQTQSKDLKGGFRSAGDLGAESSAMKVEDLALIDSWTCRGLSFANSASSLFIEVSLPVSETPLRAQQLGVRVFNQDTTVLVAENHIPADQELHGGEALQFEIGALDMLLPGRYHLTLCLRDQNGDLIDFLKCQIRVLGLGSSGGFFELPFNMNRMC